MVYRGYRFTVEWSSEDKIFVAKVVKLDCVAHGNSVYAACQEIKKVIDSVIDLSLDERV